jgi:hypothetical protein
LLLVLRELSLKTGFPLGLGFLVGVDLLGSEEVVERNTRVCCDYRVDLLGCALEIPCKQGLVG